MHHTRKYSMKSYIITLLGHGLGEQLSAECQAQAARFGITVQRRDAVNGHGWEDHLLREGLRTAGFREKKKTPGMYGNFLSHYHLWQECAQGQEPYLILEHDGYFVRPLPTDVLGRFTHVLKLDDVDPYRRDYDSIMRSQLGEDRPVEILPMSTEGRKNHGAGFYSPGSYAYIIKPQACRLLIDSVKNKGFLPTDNQLGTEVVDIQVCRPTVARLHEFYAQGNNIHDFSTAKFADQLPR
jgi:GR25 family glycosyltransferase involved in LPS biosynthesis